MKSEKRVLFCTNLPSPYRTDFFNEWGKYCDLTVCYERKKSSERDSKWVGSAPENYKAVFLELKPIGVDQSRGSALKQYIKTNKFDYIIFSNYVSPSVQKAIVFCKFHKIPYYMEYDGGFNKKDSFVKGLYKKFLLKSAVGHLTTCDEHIEYLKCLGIKENKIFKYPFSSIKNCEIRKVADEEKRSIRNEFNIHENKVVLCVGQFVYRKGFDVLIKAFKFDEGDVGLYFVGGVPTKEYLELIDGSKNIHFIGFQEKNEIKKWYACADLFVLPTREDIWGLVVNEAMSFGLPVITTNRCIAGLEMIENERNGYIVSVDNEKELNQAIKKILFDSMIKFIMEKKNFEKSFLYTIEMMVKEHNKVFNIEV